MTKMLSKVEQWINEKKDPRSVRWQAGLEAVIELFSSDMEKGRLTPVCALEKEGLSVFKAVLERVDLSPGLMAAFLPPSVANPIFPPDSIEELMRIKKGKPSYKIIIQRPGKEGRILCAEVSEHAHRPGIDIFQSGAFLGNFNYDTHTTCIMELTKAIRAHAWEKEKWQRKDYLAYTLNWFEKMIYLDKADVSVDKNHSFFHSPTLFKLNRIDALFLLLYEALHHRFKEDPETLLKVLPGAEDKESRAAICQSSAERYLLDMLSFVKKFQLLDFANFTNAENSAFQNEFIRTVRKLSSDLDKMVFPPL